MHDGTGVGEAFEVFGEISAIGPAMKPDSEFAGIGGGELIVSVFLGQFDDRGRAEAAVEVFMEKNLGDAAEIEGFHQLGTLRQRAIGPGFWIPLFNHSRAL